MVVLFLLILIEYKEDLQCTKLSLSVLFSAVYSVHGTIRTSAQQGHAGIMPTRDETVGFFSNMHRAIRDTERGVYGLLYGIRDGTDSFIYDAQKDYYNDYQK
jgi:hypothetical protein